MSCGNLADRQLFPVLISRFGGLSGNQRLVILILALLSIRLSLYAMLAGAITRLPQKFCAWDCGWYLYLASHGYDIHPETLQARTVGQPGKADWPFFPVFPGLIHFVSIWFHIAPVMAGFCIANTALCIFVFFAAKHMQLVSRNINSAALAVFLFAFPYSFYLSAPYTESTFAACTMIAFYFLARGRVMAASLSAAVLSATRFMGIAFLPIITVPYLYRVIRAWRAGDSRAAWTHVMSSLLPIALAPLGLFLFMGYMYAHTGDAFAFVHIERAWDRTETDPLTVLSNGFLQFDLDRTFQQGSGTYCALCAAASLAVAASLLFQGRFAASWFLAVSTLVPLSAGLASLPRYTLANPIFLVYLFDAVWTSKYRCFFNELIAVSLLVQLYLAHLWIMDNVSLI